MMLSRIAESLFWIGRYLERADGTARILDAHLQLLLEDPWIDEDNACRSLLAVMGAEAPEAGLSVRPSATSTRSPRVQMPGRCAASISSRADHPIKSAAW